MPELEVAELDKINPDEKEIFIGLPEITPVTERFYRKISEERLFIDKPLFGLNYPGLITCHLIRQKILYCHSVVRLNLQKVQASS